MALSSAEILDDVASRLTPKQPRGAGRPSKLTPAIQAKIVEYVANGSFFEPAAAASGIHRDTMRTWVLKGQEAAAQGKRNKYTVFIDALSHAQASNEARLAAKLSAGGEGKFPDWRAQAFILERRHKERWAAPEKHTTVAPTIVISDALAQQLTDAMRVAGQVIELPPSAITRTSPELPASELNKAAATQENE